jgi:hypothetical protein
MTWVPIKFNAGVYRQSTPYDVPNAWWDTNNVRFLSGAIQPVGGNARISETAFTSPCRKLFQWRDNNDAPWIAVGAEAKAWVYTSYASDVTPANYVPITNDGSGGGYGIYKYGEDDGATYTTGASATVTVNNSTPSPVSVTWTAHGLSAGDYVKFTSTGTLPSPLAVDTVYRVASYPAVTTNTFTVTPITGETTVMISHASPGVITAYKHGLSVGDKVELGTTGTLPSPLATGTVYYVQSVIDVNSFTIAASSGGSAINTTTDGSGAHSIIKPIITTTAGSGTHTGYKVTFDIGAYGQARSVNPLQFRKPDFWTFSNFGQDLLAVASQDGRLLHFTPGTGILAPLTEVKSTDVQYALTTATVTITTGSPGTINWTSHGLANGARVRFTATTIPTGISASSVYYVVNSATNTFQVATTLGGAGVSISTAGSAITGYSLPSWDVPTSNRGVVVTAERAVMLFGINGNPRRIGWSDFENYAGWNFASTTGQAGYLDLEATSPIVNCIRVKEGVLILTQHEAFMMRYVGAPYYYGIEKIGSTSFFAPNCIAVSGNKAVWLGMDSFWQYDGSAVRPLECPFFNDLKQDFSPIYSDFRSHMHANNSFAEFWLDYVSQDAMTFETNSIHYGECDKYVIYNFSEGWWARGTRDRTASSGATTGGYPIAIGHDKHLYQHENGNTDAGESRVGNIWAESTALQLSQDSSIVDINQVMVANSPQSASQNYQVKFLTKFTPSGTETTSAAYLPRTDGYMDTRITARDVRIRVEATDDEFWSFGPIKFDVTSSGGQR